MPSVLHNSQQLAPQQDATDKGKGLKHISETTVQLPNCPLAPQPVKFIMTITSTEHSTVSIMLHTGLQLHQSLPYRLQPIEKTLPNEIEPRQKSKIFLGKAALSGIVPIYIFHLYQTQEKKELSYQINTHT